MMHAFTRGSKKALLHLMNLSLLSLHGPLPLYGNTPSDLNNSQPSYSESGYQANGEGFQATEEEYSPIYAIDHPIYLPMGDNQENSQPSDPSTYEVENQAINQASTENQANHQTDQPSQAYLGFNDNVYQQVDYSTEQTGYPTQQADYSTEQVDYSNCWQDPSIECPAPPCYQNQIQNRDLKQDQNQEKGDCQNPPPCEKQPQTATLAPVRAQAYCEQKTDACNAAAYVQAKKVIKLRPITVVVGLLIVGALVVTLMNNNTHQHIHGCRPCKRGR